MTAGQPLDPKAEFSQSFVREIDLPMLKGIFATAADEERELVSINPEEAAKVEPIALRFVIGNEARCGREVEQAIVAIQGAVKFADLGISYLMAFGPHRPHHHLEQGEGEPHALTGSGGEPAQDRRGVPWVGVPVRE